MLFVLLTLAAVALGVLLLRGGLSNLTGDTSDAAAASRGHGSPGSPVVWRRHLPITVRNRHR